ncbi:MAG: HAD family hydrolase [Nitrospiria bacterium]
MNLIALDLDGTLEDSRRDMIASVHRVRATLFLSEKSDDQVAPWVNQGMDLLYRNCFDDYLKSGNANGRIEIVQRAYELDYLNHVACETRLYPGIASSLESLFKMGRLVIVTNKPEKISDRLLQELEIDHMISGLVGGDTIGKIKPDPEMLRAAAKKVGFTPDSGAAFMIGDTPADIKMGRAFGATTIWCSWGYSNSPLENPQLIARNPEDLPVLVQSELMKAI